MKVLVLLNVNLCLLSVVMELPATFADEFILSLKAKSNIPHFFPFVKTQFQFSWAIELRRTMEAIITRLWFLVKSLIYVSRFSASQRGHPRFLGNRDKSYDSPQAISIPPI